MSILFVGGCSSGTPTASQPSPTPLASPTAAGTPVGTWRPIAAAPISARVEHTAVWTGREMLIWGGGTFPVDAPDEEMGAAYDPKADRWRILPQAPIERREAHVATFTGGEMLIWGGMSTNALLSDGAAYNPGTDSWRWLAPSPLRGGVGFVGAWTGDEWLLVEANKPGEPQAPSGMGAAYNPTTDTWREIADAPLRPGFGATATWTGSTLVLIRFSSHEPSGGAQYDPQADTWMPIPGNPGLGLQGYPFATSTDDGLLVTRDTIQTSEGVQAGPAAWIYEPSQMVWQSVAVPPAQLPYGPPVFGGGLVMYYAPGGEQSWAYSPEDDQWIRMPIVEDRLREFWTTVWTGQDLLVWGGSNPGGPTTTDGRALDLSE